MSTATIKPAWPADAVIIVAANAGTENRARMEAVVPATCRDCGADLAADTHTIRVARQLPIRRGRPVEFLCIDCCVKYDVSSLDQIHDHAGVLGGAEGAS